MTAHPRAKEFLELQHVCTADVMNRVETAEDKAAAQTDLAWFQKDREDLIDDLGSVGVEPLAVLPVRSWRNICQLYGLYDLHVLNNFIKVQLPAGWLEQRVVFTQASGYNHESRRFEQFSEQALLEAETLDHASLLDMLMPNGRSRNFFDQQNHNDWDVSIQLPPAPVREQVVMKRLQKSGAPFQIVADKSAIAFAPPLIDQMRSANVVVDHKAYEWETYEPIITVVCGYAVALVGQWGEYLFETLAIKAALTEA